MAYAPEPAHAHGAATKTAVLLCNLGTPDEATASAVRRYLAEFLSDRRVVEIPSLLWKPILHGIVLRTRPARSARKYASIWTADGSPLAMWTAKQATMLRGYLGQRGHAVVVRQAMRYGRPSIASQLDALRVEGAERILVMPLYPQYAAATTASVADAVADWMKTQRNLPEMRFVKHYHDDPGYIAALARRLEDHWLVHGRPDRLVLSFHGLPARSLTLGDPYHCECLKTGRLLRERLKVRDEFVVVSFQSRFGKARWLQPYTEPTLVQLARSGVGRVDVMCPGFVADCLETLEEIDVEARAAFMAAGGREFTYVPCLNDRPEWIAALSALSLRHLQGWPTHAGTDDAVALEAQRDRARGAGAIA